MSGKAALACGIAWTVLVLAAGQPLEQIYVIPNAQPLPDLQTLRNNITLTAVPLVLQGPADGLGNGTGVPYVELTGRVYNGDVVHGVIRVPQGSSLRMRVCNQLSALGLPLRPESDSPKELLREANVKGKDPNYLGPNGFKDTNVISHHWHGHYGNPGTSNTHACDPPISADSRACYRGDNIFSSILPGQCNEYQYDVTNNHAPGLFWMHPHHHGSTALNVAFASLPVIVEPSASGFQYLATPSCQTLRPLIEEAPEVILHIQTVLAGTNEEGGPDDDGYTDLISQFDPANPGYVSEDPLAAEVPAAAPAPAQPGYPTVTSGANGNFAIINGAYNPTIALEAGKVYRFRIVLAIVMKWMDLSLDAPGCVMGIYARDGNMLRAVPRMADHLMLAAANRVELLISCQAGSYQLRTGAGPMSQHPDCTSTHCELLKQDLATLNVTGDMSSEYDMLADPATAESCMPRFPAYLADHRLSSASRTSQIVLTGSSVTSSQVLNAAAGAPSSATTMSFPAPAPAADQVVLSKTLVNFTNPDPQNVAPADICGVNGKFWMQNGYTFQELIGELTSWELLNVNLHPHHHHIQPFQIVNITGDASDPGTWQVGDYTDTLLLPDLVGSAEVKWVPGPYEVIGNGYSVLHCHFLPHADEGCMAIINFANKTSSTAASMAVAGRKLL
ncbi:hypothetical protein WJX72_008005 [[Myrmecia] bisecta]|uniref:Plastocyanin-like domain-containing protein n=1 Tax=[Myrmecia] bisecta TaxID=41462 RepID=A0AAW1QC77_9CHLO